MRVVRPARFARIYCVARNTLLPDARCASKRMPELPEVETMCRGIAPIVGRRVVRVERPPVACRPISIRPRLDVFRRRAEGKTIVAVERLGKRVVIWLADKAHGLQPVGLD